MPEFKINVTYLGIRKQKFFKDKDWVDYHKFSVEEPEKLPRQYFSPQTRLGKGNFKNSFDFTAYCWIFISPNLIKKVGHDFRIDQEYCFLAKLGEPKTADFTIYYYVPPEGYEYEEHKMVLKTKDYFENTVKKIGFWDSENYFYEVGKKGNLPPKPNQSNTNQPTKNTGLKIFLICLPFLMLALFILLIKWMSKKKKG